MAPRAMKAVAKAALVKKATSKVTKKAATKAAMKVTKRKAVSRVASGRLSKALVLRGSRERTTGGLTARDLTKNRWGSVVSKKRAANGKKSAWIRAVRQARTALGLSGFCVVGGPTPLGQALLAKARNMYQAL